MSDIVLAADALAVAQDRRATITAYDAATTYRVTINGKTVSVVGQGGIVTTTAAALVTALNLDTVPSEFQEETWSNSTGTLIGLMDEAGKPFTFATSVNGGTGTFGAASDTTANDGPEALTAANCKDASSGARGLPAGGDTFTLEALDSDLKYALDALSGVTLAALYIEASFTGQVGLVPTNEDGTVSYDEYRQQYLLAPASVCVIGDGAGDGSDLILHDASNVQCAWTVLKSEQDGAIAGLAAVILKGTHASNTLKVVDATVDVAPFAGETATIATLTAVGSAEVRTGLGVTLSTVNVGGSAVVELNSAASLADITVINVYDQAEVIVKGDNATTTINVHGPDAKLTYLSSGTIGALNLIDSPTIDATNNPNTFTVTTLSGSGQPKIIDPNSRMTVTNAVDPKNSQIFDWDWQLRPGRQLTLGAP